MRKKRILHGLTKAHLFLVRLITFAGAAFLYLFGMSRVYPFLLLPTRTMGITLAAFTVMYILMARIYGGMAVGEKKSKPIVFSMAITLLFADLAAHIFLGIMNVTVVHDGRFVFETPLRLLILWLIQLAFVILMTYFGNWLYFVMNEPARCLIVTKSGAGHRKILRELARYKKQYRVEGVISFQNPAVRERIEEAELIFFYGLTVEERSDLVRFAYEKRKAVYYSLDLPDIVSLRGKCTNYSDQTFLASPERTRSLEERAVKRLADIGISALFLVITSPIFLITALAIKLEDGGPVFYRQKRATIFGRSFSVIKFRSMRAETGHIHKSVKDGDDRITKTGRIIRKFRIDELPQLINVLKGDMSLVGPRPEMLENVEKYTSELPEFEYRLKMKAGLTGLAQVYGRYNTDPIDKLIMDLTYIEQYSVWLDLVLLTPEESTEAFAAEAAEDDIVE